jgi:hypothetical protein
VAGPDAMHEVSLLVSNQSLDLTPVDIAITVDRRQVVHDEFEVGPPEMPQHNWREFRVRLASGPRRIRAESQRGRAHLEKRFEPSGVQSIMVAFWHGGRSAPKRPGQGAFTIEISPRKAATM